MDDPRNEYLTEKEFDAYLESLGIELEDVNYEDDGSGEYKTSARKMLFPFSFSRDALNLLQGAACAECGSRTNLTLDHIEPVCTWFNRKGYTKSRADRCRWYSKTSNLQVLCRSCNSAKGSGGEQFRPDRVAECIRRKLI